MTNDNELPLHLEQEIPHFKGQWTGSFTIDPKKVKELIFSREFQRYLDISIVNTIECEKAIAEAEKNGGKPTKE